jgi:hypothetical protein
MFSEPQHPPHYNYHSAPELPLGSEANRATTPPPRHDHTIVHSPIRKELMPPRSRRFATDNPTPFSSRRAKDALYHTQNGAGSSDHTHVSDKQESAIIKYVTHSKTDASFDGNVRHWPAFEDILLSFLRGHGIAHTIEDGYLLHPSFSMTHNEALYTFLLAAVSKHPTVYAVFRRAPSGDGHTAWCYLSSHYGVRDPSALLAELQFFTPYDSETPFATALRLSTLYADLSQADKPHAEWEMVAKLIDILEHSPQADFGATTSRIEDASNSRGITFDEAMSMIGHRQSILDSRSAVASIVPRTRPVYKAAVLSNLTEPPPPPPSSNTTTQIAELQATVDVFLAGNHRHQPPPKSQAPPREKCPQTPGLHLRRVAAPCRVDHCSTPTRSRLCEEHALQLISRKAKFHTCTTDNVPKYALYGITPADGATPEWRGIVMRDSQTFQASSKQQ